MNESEASYKQRRIEWEKGIKVEGLPILTIEEVDKEMEKLLKKEKEQR